MTQHTVVRGVRWSVAVFAALLAMSCSKGEQGKAKESSTAAAPGGGGPRATALPGALAKPLDQYTGDELFALARQLQFGGGVDSARRCRGQAACRGPQPRTKTRIRVDAVVGQDSLSGAALPANGVIAARAINRGQLADTMYNMQPGGRYENYLIVLPVAGGSTATWRLEELTITAGQRTHRTIATGTFRPCNHPFQPGPRADFKTCAQAAATVRPAAFGLPPLLQNNEAPIWIGCLAGCCTADPPDGHT